MGQSLHLKHRGNKHIIPFYFLPGASKLFDYKGDGIISISKKVNSPFLQIEFSDKIDALASEHERLQIIRQVWYYIASCRYGIKEVRDAILDDTLRNNFLTDCGVPARNEKKIKQPISWFLLCDYYWFYKYFSKHYSNQTLS